MGTSLTETVMSVGIDIGTTTTQFVISRLTVKNVAPGTLVPRMEITDKVIEYKSDIHFTPIKDNNLVDTEKVFELITSEFSKAGVTPEQINTGAVIITGETAKKANARSISGRVAGYAGDFVVATAGGKLESVIAGKGSGACDYSRKNYCTVANIDIGGGTANVGIFKNGKAIDSCCINVGGRLLQINAAAGHVTHISEPMKAVMADCNLDIAQNARADSGNVERLSRRMAEVVLECVSSGNLSELSRKLLMTDALRLDYSIDTVMISGGVADHVYNNHSLKNIREIARYGDIGPMLGRQIFNLFSSESFQLIKPTETIRATVIGAGAQTVDVSGSTISVHDPILPFKNIPVVIPFADEIIVNEEAIAREIRQAVDNFYEEDSLENIAIGLQGKNYLTFADIQVVARGITGGLERVIAAGLPVIVVLEQDIGKVMGQSLRVMNPGAHIICVDQIIVNEGDYIDIGKSMAGGSVVPVVIKTLVFETEQIE